jgi:hypothetical protein
MTGINRSSSWVGHPTEGRGGRRGGALLPFAIISGGVILIVALITRWPILRYNGDEPADRRQAYVAAQHGRPSDQR